MVRRREGVKHAVVGGRAQTCCAAGWGTYMLLENDIMQRGRVAAAAVWVMKNAITGLRPRHGLWEWEVRGASRGRPGGPCSFRWAGVSSSTVSKKQFHCQTCCSCVYLLMWQSQLNIFLSVWRLQLCLSIFLEVAVVSICLSCVRRRGCLSVWQPQLFASVCLCGGRSYLCLCSCLSVWQSQLCVPSGQHHRSSSAASTWLPACQPLPR